MPRFVRNFLDGQPTVLDGLKSFVGAVKVRSYPAREHCFS